MKKKDLKDIFMAGVDRVLGYNAVNDYLNKNPIPGDLNLISIGKAGSSMAKAALENKYIKVYNKGIHERDFTYVVDVAKAIYNIINKPPNDNMFQILNVCSSKTIKLMEFIKLIEKLTNKKINKKFVKKQKGDVIKTYGNNSKLKKITKIVINNL